MIRIFDSAAKTYTTNGLRVIGGTAKVHKEDNGKFYCDLQCGVEYADVIVSGNIVVVPTPSGAQAFRMENITKTRTTITAKAWHVSYDAKNYLIADSNVVNKTGAQAMTYLNAATEPTSPFTCAGDVSTVLNYRCVRKSLYEAWQELVERTGGHIVRNNWTVDLNTSIGSNNSVTIRYKKNLQNITAKYNWDEVCTKILPVGQEGVLLNAVDANQSIYLASATQYNRAYCKTVTFETGIDPDDYTTGGVLDTTAYKTAIVAELNTMATAYLAEHCVPDVNYTVQSLPEKITDVGDTVQVIDEVLGISFTTNVTAYDYNCNLEEYISIEFGTFTRKLSDLVNTMQTVSQKAVDDYASQLTFPDRLKSSDLEGTATKWSQVVCGGNGTLVAVAASPDGTLANAPFQAVVINSGASMAVTQKNLSDSTDYARMVMSNGTTMLWRIYENSSLSQELELNGTGLFLNGAQIFAGITETGTFTATYNGSSNTWNYAKNGKVVTVWGKIGNASSMGANDASGLPYNAAHAQTVQGICDGGSHVNIYALTFELDANADTFRPYSVAYNNSSGQNVTGISGSPTMGWYQIGDTAEIRFTYICE